MNAEDRVESADVVDDVHVLPSTPVRASTVTGSTPVLPARHAKGSRVWPGVVLALAGAVGVDVALIVGLIAGLEALGRAS